MLQVIDVIAPIFLLVLCGFLAARGGIVNAEGGRAIGAIVLYVSFPALIIRAFVERGVTTILDWRLILAYGAAAVLVFALMHTLYRARGRGHARAGIAALAASASNSGFVGFPLISLTLGPDVAAVILANALIVENFFTIPLGLGMAGREGAASPAAAFRQALGAGIAKNPMVISCAVGAAISLTGLHLPGPVDKAAELLAASSTPMALVSVGITLALTGEGRARRDIGEALAAKLVALPVLALGIALALHEVAGLTETRVIGIVFTAACPIMATLPIIGRRAGEEPWCARTMMASMVLGIGTLSVWILALAP